MVEVGLLFFLMILPWEEGLGSCGVGNIEVLNLFFLFPSVKVLEPQAEP
jgi:hypothetical protein